MTMTTEPAAAKPTRQKAATATATAVGQHLDLSRQRVVGLVDEGVLRRQPDGKFALDECRIAYLRWLRDPSRRSARSEADAKFVAAKTALLEIRTMERLGKLVPVELFEEMIDAIVGMYRTELSGLPARFTRDISERRRLEKLVHELLKRVANEAKRRAEKIDAALGNGKAEALGATDDDA